MLYWDLTMPMTTWQNLILILEPLLDELEIGKGGLIFEGIFTLLPYSKKMREITILNFNFESKVKNQIKIQM